MGCCHLLTWSPSGEDPRLGQVNTARQPCSVAAATTPDATSQHFTATTEKGHVTSDWGSHGRRVFFIWKSIIYQFQVGGDNGSAIHPHSRRYRHPSGIKQLMMSSAASRAMAPLACATADPHSAQCGAPCRCRLGWKGGKGGRDLLGHSIMAGREGKERKKRRRRDGHARGSPGNRSDRGHLLPG